MQFNFFKYFFPKSEEVMAKIAKLDNGHFVLVDRGGNFIQEYTRRRDAVRGAARRGLVIA